MVRVILGDFTAATRTDCVLICVAYVYALRSGFLFCLSSQLLHALTVVFYHSYTAATRTDCDCSYSMYGLIFRILYVFINDPCLICTVPFCLLTFVIRNGPSHSIVPNLF